MQIRELSVPDSYEITPVQHADDRGLFFEWYRFDLLEQAIGHPLTLRQANVSLSRKGVVRGIHFADVPLGQAKLVTATHGAVLDYVIDLRVGSPAFGRWDAVLLDSEHHRSMYLAEGLGHAFVALTEDATVSYLVTDTYHADREHAINPLDPDIALAFPPEAGELLLSPRDTGAPSLAEALAGGLLTTWDDARAHYASLDTAAQKGGA
ncbi:dTDP-4-dehydrorhamnose 3,5-epimerase [Subtercola boreus]|uniref:dTDP-4-dehydrorhamnose 3,5-epimerase n=1 Tax=Subtercola boreus TaxID=120213 RepID=A0A3E0VER9_9MICO|nr:dTDP-4-dehydrorhamnose 3,5-epimerase [Subtercola boreus]RFA08426.1 dTDP-4-dehydrorhamnose 3,5-epimerase [Subtercola boreus]TQL54658.1 dTDP-4-dehydrorhamnose 3,5-epimerase [Subtercola boreus]